MIWCRSVIPGVVVEAVMVDVLVKYVQLHDRFKYKILTAIHIVQTKKLSC